MASFDDLEYYPGDPILGLADLYAVDTHADKVNLGVGIYLDSAGRLPLPAAVRAVEGSMAADLGPRGYIPIGGLPAFVTEARKVVFGARAPVVDEGRVATVQTLGGSGALKECADFLHSLLGVTTVALSDPTWGNHEAIFGSAGYDVMRYRYHDDVNHRVDLEGMLADLGALEAGTVVVLHACCHNPTGYDLTGPEWQQVARVCADRWLTPFLDMAYQGFANGLDADRIAVDTFVASGQRFFVGNSFSKTFGLYGERVGALSVVCASADEARRVESQLCKVIRANYSTPPTHGAQVVAIVLADEHLRASWLEELARMRERISAMRVRLVTGLRAQGVDDMDFITEQYGMFSFCGLTPQQMHRLRSDFGIYGTDGSRICVAALNEGNVDVVARGIAAVRRG